MADPRPKGMQISSAHIVVVKVASSSGCIPNDGGLNSGAHSRPPKNSPRLTSEKKSSTGRSNDKTMARVVATDSSPQENSRATITRSPQRGRATPRGRVGSLGVARDGAVCNVVVLSARIGLAGGELGELLLGLGCLLLGQGDEQGFFGDLLVVVHVEVEEGLDLGPRQGLVAGVDEQRPRQGRVAAVLDRLGAGGDTAAAAVDLDALDLALVLLQVGQAEVAQTALGAADPGHGDVVVLGGRVVGAAAALLTVDCLGEVVEGARVGAGAEQLQRLVGEAGVDLVPVVDLAALVPDRLELGHGQALAQ